MNNNTKAGARIEATGADLNEVILTNNSVNGNGIHGLDINVSGGGSFGRALLSGNTVTNNVNTGLRVSVNDMDSKVTTTSFINNLADSNGVRGFLATVLSDGFMGTVNFTNNIAKDHVNNQGFYARTQTGGDIEIVNFLDNSSMNNATHGFRITSDALGSEISKVNFINNLSDSMEVTV